MSTDGILEYQGTKRVLFRGDTSNIVFDTRTTSLGIGVTGSNNPSSNLYITGNAYVSSNLEIGGVMTMGVVNVTARHNLQAITTIGNVTTQTVQFDNPTTAFTTTGNVEIKNINMLHTANTASIKLNSNVVTEFPRSKKLIKYPRVALTSASDNAYENGYKVTVSNQDGNMKAYTVFDGGKGANSGGLWYSGTLSHYSTSDGSAVTSGTNIAPRLDTNTDYGEWIGIELPVAIKLQSFHLWQQYNDHNHFPQSSTLYAKRESGDPWNEIYRYDNRTRSLEPDRPEIFDDVDSERFYKHFALVCRRRVQGTNATTGASLGEWELYGVPEYDPEAYGTDVVVKSVPNVPNTDWLEVYYDAKDLGNGIITAVDDLTPGGTKDGTAIGDLTVSDGVFTFDGTNDLITSTTLSSHFTGDPTVTYACWVKFSAVTTNQMFFTVNAPGVYQTGAIGGLFLGSDGTLYNTVGSRGIQALEKLVVDRWYHLVGTKSPGNTGLNTQKLYINGIRAAAVHWNVSGNQVIGTNPVMRIGGAGNGTSDKLNGSMANARLFNRVLTTDEVWQLYAYQKEYFGHGDLGMTIKGGRLGIGTSEPNADLDVKGVISFTEESFDIRNVTDAQWPASAGYPNHSGDNIGNQFMWRTLGSGGGTDFNYRVPRNGILMVNVTMIHRLLQFRAGGNTTHAVYWCLRKSTDNGVTWNALTSHLIGHRWINSSGWDQEWHPVAIPFTGRVNEGDQVALFVQNDWSNSGGTLYGNFQVYDCRMRGILI